MPRWTFEPGHTAAEFKARHMMVTWVRGGGIPYESRLGTIQAFSAETDETAWTYQQRAYTTSRVATGGRLIFGDDANGRFRALDQAAGEVLWEINLGSAVTGFRSSTPSTAGSMWR